MNKFWKKNRSNSVSAQRTSLVVPAKHREETTRKVTEASFLCRQQRETENSVLSTGTGKYKYMSLDSIKKEID
jgi:hypothetical protein